ncbi:hypothetical protein DFJ77DRAFT_441848 [Powellomyces hirtus]|nr:hypothetical protein DFJ77DRAFT_441848 [Powellomyces hirtus]
MTLGYLGAMLPWFINEAICSYKFSIHFSDIITNTAKASADQLTDMKNKQTDPLLSMRDTGEGIPADTLPVQTNVQINGMNRAKKSGGDMLRIAQRVRWVGIGIVVDRILFICAYLSVTISTNISWKHPPMNSASYGFYAFYLMVLQG